MYAVFRRNILLYMAMLDICCVLVLSVASALENMLLDMPRRVQTRLPLFASVFADNEHCIHNVSTLDGMQPKQNGAIRD